MSITGQQIRERRAALGLTQEQLAVLLGVRRATIADWERETVGRKLLDSRLIDRALADVEREIQKP